MKPTPFPEANLVLRKPESMTDEECSSLPVHRADGAMVSCWEPTDEERQAIAAGAPIWLWVIGQGHPPVSLEVASPFAAAPTEH